MVAELLANCGRDSPKSWQAPKSRQVLHLDLSGPTLEDLLRKSSSAKTVCMVRERVNTMLSEAEEEVAEEEDVVVEGDVEEEYFFGVEEEEDVEEEEKEDDDEEEEEEESLNRGGGD